jgi:hypothetical protein
LNIKIKGLIVGILFFGALSQTQAAPKLTIKTDSENITVGQTFVAIIGANSDGVKVISFDVLTDFDKTTYELIEVLPYPRSLVAFDYDQNNFVPIIHNDKGTMEITLPPKDPSILEGRTVNGPIMKMVFKKVNEDQGFFRFRCQKDSVKESNIISSQAIDVIDCQANDYWGEYVQDPTPTFEIGPTGQDRRLTNGPNIYLEPLTDFMVNQTTTVIVGADSKGIPIISLDVVINFPTDLEVVSAKPVRGPEDGFKYDFNNFVPLIHNDMGKLEVTLPPDDPAVLKGTKAQGPLFAIVFKTKKESSGQIKIECQPDSVKESNILSSDAVDIISCKDNGVINIESIATKSGDADGDGKISLTDLGIWKTEFAAKVGTRADFNGDGEVDLADLGIWKTEFVK